jgi:6-phosphogluconolactonase (cycloisomerase 2 family)
LNVGQSVEITNNGGDRITVSANGSFTFGVKVDSESTYTVVVSTQPRGQTCTVANSTGPVNANVNNVAVSCRGQFVYATNELTGTVATYAIDNSTGTLSVVGSPVTTGTGATGDFPAPRGVAVDYGGKFAYVTNRYGDTVVTYEINSATGALTAVSSISTTTGAGPLGVVVDPAGKFVYVAEAGGKKIASYSINSATGALALVSNVFDSLEIYNLAMSPSGDFVYATQGYQGYVISYGINRTTGALTLSSFWTPLVSSNGVAVHPNGKYAYVAAGDADSSAGGVYILSLDATAGGLTQQGSLMATNGQAQALVVDPTGKFLYVTSNNTVIAYAINTTTGALSAIGSPLNLGLDSSPTGITVDRSGRFVYVVNSGTNTIASFAINAITGALTSVGTTSTGNATLPKAITSF